MTSTVSSLSQLLLLLLPPCMVIFLSYLLCSILIHSLTVFKYLVDPPSFVVVPLTPSPPIPKDSFQL
ncbi:hypothetical protein ASPTUDRAFT_36704 [Aspergillus tubingensis CBS 134.48]|uniref:Uncharacterized protein n=1 Tax=Aspergillus tubingensis (strain CBS 134.48) TaxID=767770 RepID=A0A1L9NL95_ASPTC|nr:hypothetical protein ASPTUDRAFT_36704 [Aspergillus tubingensis CBS 134.48]